MAAIPVSQYELAPDTVADAFEPDTPAPIKPLLIRANYAPQR